MTEESLNDAAKPASLNRFSRRDWNGIFALPNFVVVVWNILPPNVPRRTVILTREANGDLREQNGGLYLLLTREN
jgi:hypothetical protein